MAVAARWGLSPERRASIFHTTSFLTGGVAVAYLPVWMEELGLSSPQIGLVNAMPFLLLLVLSVWIGRLADRASDWRVVIIGLSVLSGLAALGMGLVTEFWGVLMVFALTYTPASAIVSVLDAATLRMTQRRGSNFGAIRAWGTVGFVASAAVAGLAIGHWGGAAFVPMFIGAALLRAAFSLQLPRFRAPGHHEALTAGGTGALRGLLRPWFILPCIAFAMINAAHFFLGFMGGLVWKLDGIGAEWFGPLAAYAAVGEAAVMFLWGRMGLKVSARSLLIIAGVVGAARFAAMALHPGLPMLFALQTLHAITLPFSYFGLVQFVADWAPEENAAEAQGFAAMLTQGFAVVTFGTFGGLVGLFGTGVFFVAAGMCLLAAGAALVSLRLMPRHRRDGA